MHSDFVEMSFAFSGIMLTFLIMFKIHCHERSKILRYYEIRQTARNLSEKIDNSKKFQKYPHIQTFLELSKNLSELRPIEYRKFTFSRKVKKTMSDAREAQSNKFFDNMFDEMEKAPRLIQECVYEQYDICHSIYAVNNPIRLFFSPVKKSNFAKKYQSYPLN